MSLEQEIRSLVDRDQLRLQLEVALPSRDFKTLDQLQARDEAIGKELEQLQELWVISNLFREIEVNLELKDFETVFFSLRKLETKINSGLRHAHDLKSEVKDKYLVLYDSSVEQLRNVWSQLLVVEEDKITFNIEADSHGQDLPVNYETVLQLIQDNNLTVQLHANVSHIIDQKLVTAIVNGFKLTLEDNVIYISTPGTFKELIPSVYALVQFISQIPNNQNIIHYITNRLFDYLRDQITVNVETLYNSREYQAEFLKLSKFLTRNDFKRHDLENWINHELNDIVIQNLLDLHVGQVRDLFSGLKHSALKELVERSDNPGARVEPTEKKQINEDEDEDEDAWGWGDEVLEFGDEDELERQSKEESKGDTKEFDEDWDAWGDDQEEEEKEQQAKPKRKLVSKLSKGNTPSPAPVTQPSTTYKTTKIPDSIIKIMDSFISTNSKLPQEYQDIHMSKLNYIATSYYILATEFFQGQEFLLFNDLAYLNSIKFLPRLKELTDKLLHSKLSSYTSQIKRQYIRLQGLNPELSSQSTFGITDNIQNILSAYFAALEPLPLPSHQLYIETTMKTLYDWIIGDIFAKESIGEDESEYLSTIIQRFLNLKTPTITKVINHSKLVHIEFILKSHLKDIMESFYNAEFFDLTTEELIKLIDALFADSNLKRNSIKEIKELREATD